LVIQSMPFLLKKMPLVRLLIVGGDAGLGYISRLKRLAEEIGVAERTLFYGYSYPEQMRNMIRNSSVGLIPHRLNELTHTTVPNKLFDYMAAGIPVAATAMRPVVRILKETGAGIIIPCNPEGIADSLVALLSNKDKRIRMGQNGRRAILMKYNWGAESKKVIRSITNLIERRKKASRDGFWATF